MNSKKKFLAGTLAGSLAVGGFALGRSTQIERVQADPIDKGPAAVTTPSGRALPSFAGLAAQASPTVVYIKAVAVEKTAQAGPQFGLPPNPFGEGEPFPGFRGQFPAPPPGGFRRQGSGSGFIVRGDGIILTNNHMVEGAKDITVTLADKREFNAKVLGRDPKTDLAVLKIDAKGDLPVAKLGDSTALQVGDWVMAIGNPFGLSNTVTAGIVSAKGRVIGAGPYDDFIQTDASINPGNSGGPLFNEQGEVVGINSAIFSQTGGNVGIGFAIPINLAKQLLPELETKGSVTRGWLGVAIQQVTPELARSLGTDGAHGALVADVTKDGPAEKAGVKRGDVIVAYDGKKIENSSSLPTLVAATPVGRTVPVEVLRDGKSEAVNVTISKLNEKEVAMDEPPAAQGKLGLALRDLRPEERRHLSLEEDEGVGVEGVMPDSPAAEAGIRAGDVILQVNRTAVGSVEEMKKAVHQADADKPLLFLLHRADGNNQFVTLAAK